jgi:hypothetical protein
MFYRCLHSAGFQVVLINATVERNLVRCGLSFWGANLSQFPLKLTDVDTGNQIGRVVPPEAVQQQASHSWFHDSRDDLEVEIVPLELLTPP